MNQRKIGILLTYASQIIHIISGLIYTPIMLRLLGQSEYGLYQLVNSVVSYLGLLSLGFGAAYVRFFSRYRANKDSEGEAKLNGMFMTIFSIMALLALGSGIIMVLNIDVIFHNGLKTDEISKARNLMLIMIINLAITFPNSVFDCIITAHEKFYFQKMIIFLQSLFNPLLTLPLLFLGYGSVGMVLVSSILVVLKSVLNIYYCLNKLNVRFVFGSFNFSLLKEISIFTFFIFLNQIIDQINWNVGKFLLGRYTGTIAVAIYGVGAQINTMYIQFSSAISSVFVPKVNNIVADNDDNKKLSLLMLEIGRIQFVIMMLILTGFIFFGKHFFILWAGKNYEQAYYVTLLLIVPVTIPLIQNIGIEIQRAKNKHHVRSIVYFIIAIGNIIVSIPLIKCWGVKGAALGTSLSLFIGNGVFMNWYYHYRLGLDMFNFWKSIFSFFPGLILPLSLGVFLTYYVDLNNLFYYIVSIVTYTICYCISIFLLGLNDNERLEISEPIIKRLSK